MCSFTQETLVCSACGQLLSTSSILFRTCDPKPKVHCNTYKRRAKLRRYVPADECNGCSRRMLDEETDLLETMETERMAAGESASNSEYEAGEEGYGMGLWNTMLGAGFGWREVKLEDYIKPARRRRRGRA